MKDESKIDVLDKGFVRLVDYMGDDTSIVEAARVSYGKGTKKTSDDESLIRYLMKHKHTSPFEMAVLKFHIKCPIFVERQFVRHRTQSMNQISLRYSESKDEFYVPDIWNIQKQSVENKQGRDIDDEFNLEIKCILQSQFEEEQKEDYNFYVKKIDAGMSRELARINLPVSLYTEFYTQMNLHNLFHFLKLRLDLHAQYEIRVVANAMYDIVKSLYPICSKAFEDYVLNSKSFSFEEMNVIKRLVEVEMNKKDFDISKYLEDGKLSKRELKEFIQKLEITNTQSE